ncbi:MAG: amidase [Candidatus Rokubacteria bacterium]|nr:amidase [Candidatus Rokubacteria bacterium]
MPALHDLTAAEAARRIRAGSLSPVDLVTACLAQIGRTEASVRAWVHLDGPAALRTAHERESEARAGRFLGALHGVPVALKDIFDAAGFPTQAGAPAFAHRRPTVDAASVARLRAHGAVILGKVTTTAFAYLDPSPTRNPWNLEHTPGGSSSGPAAAVAARMTPLALGSQTVGSVLRPAAYCGVVGLKPTHGRISTAGVVPLAWSLDHVGIFSRSVEDAALALGLLAGVDPADPLSSAAPVDDYLAGWPPVVPPRLGLIRALLERATPAAAEHIETVTRVFREAGGVVMEATLPDSFEGLHDAGATVVRVEAAAYHASTFATHAAEYPPRIREAIGLGQAIGAVEFLAAQARRRRFREEMAPIAARYDALLTPAAAGPAPRGLESTGDPYFCAPWSFAGMPAIAVPSGLAPEGLPLSLQLVGGVLGEAPLLAAAAWCERVLGFQAAPRA